MITIRQKTIDEQIAEIEAKYQKKFDECAKIFTTISLADGVTQETKIANLRSEYQSFADQKDAEILAVLGGA